MDIRYKILEDRENRILLIDKRINETNNFFVTVKANICGVDKNIKETNLILTFFLNKVLKNLDCVGYEKMPSYDGNYYLIEILEKDAIVIKKKLIEIESSEIGRFIDLDLYTGDVHSISRNDMDIPKRKCIVCGEEYGICVRSGKHTLLEVFEKTVLSIRDCFIKEIVRLSVQSLLEEVKAHPKFGLVTEVDSGKHKDMDYRLFVDSIKSIEEYLYKYAEVGFDLNEDSFDKLRYIGLEAESSMFNATNGVNTHKGAIFLLGLLLPSIVDTIYNDKVFTEIQDNVKMLSRDILNDFDNINDKVNLTYGELIYKQYGITGIRGVVKDGMDIAFVICDMFVDSDVDNNTRVIDILLYCMKDIDDTVILHKKDIRTLQMVKDKAKEIINVGGYSTELGKKLVEEFTDECIQLGISPGGSADLVSVILILIKVRENFYNI